MSALPFRQRWLHMPSRIGAYMVRYAMQLHQVTRSSARQQEAFIAEVISPRTGQPDVLPLENLLQTVLLSEREPIALEIVGTAYARHILIRVTSARSLAHVSAQVRAHIPQTEVRTLGIGTDERGLGDPLRVSTAEGARALELLPREAAHLPLKLYDERQLGQVGVDPLLGVFAAMNNIPAGCRVVVQLALAPAPEAWSHRLQRLAVEHPLAQERAREMAHAQTGNAGGSIASGLPVLPLLALLALVVLGRRLLGRLTPNGLDGLHDVHHLLLVVLASLGTAISAIALIWLRARRRSSIYSMRLVEERTLRVAARARLTILAIGPAAVSHDVPRWNRIHRIPWPASKQPHALAPAPQAALATVLDQLVAAYRQHALASGNGLAPRRLSRRAAVRFVARWARQAQRSRNLLNVRELAALWHLPGGDAVVPFLERTRAKRLLAPVTPLSAGYRLGASEASGHVIPVRLPVEALQRNALLVAKTGKGKSTLLQHLALARLVLTADQAVNTSRSSAALPVVPAALPTLPAQARSGLVVVDPHGDLMRGLLPHVPPERRDDVVVVDLADTAYPIALNPLDVLLGRDRDKAVESLLGILSQIWAKFWGPRMQNALEYALKTLYEANEVMVAADPQQGPERQYTLLDVAPLLTTPSFRKEVLVSVRDLTLRSWWKHYYDDLDVRLRTEIINPVLTKMAAFSGSRVARRIVGQGRSTLDLAEVVREGQALLVNTARGVVGGETATLVGATLLGILAVTLEEQARLHPDDRRRVLLVVDEFQTLLGVDYGAMLSELRKFGGTFALATQALAHLDALDPTLRPTVLANVDALYAFATSAEDARVLAHELDDVVEVTDLINQDDYTCYAKLTLDGRRLPVFSLVLDPPPHGEMEMAEQLHARARMRYARPVTEVDELLAEAAERYTPPHEVRQGKKTEQSPEAEQQTQVATTVPAEIGVREGIAPVSKNGRGRRGWRPRPSRQEIAAAGDLWAGLMNARSDEPQTSLARPPDRQKVDMLPSTSLASAEPADPPFRDDADGSDGTDDSDEDEERTYE